MSKPVWERTFAREYSVQYVENAWKCIAMDVNGFFPGVKKQLYIPDGKNIVGYVSKKEMDKLREALVKIIFDNDKYQGMVNKFFRTAGEYLAYSKQFKRLDLKSLNNHQLISLYNEYQRIVVLYTNGIWAFHISNEMIGEKANEIFEKYVKLDDPDRNMYLQVLFRAVKDSFIIEFHKKVLALSFNDNSALKGLFEEYKWMPCLDIHNSPWSLREFVDYIKNIKPNDDVGLISYDDAITKLNINKDDKKMFDAIKHLAYMKDTRDFYRRRSVCLARSLFVEIARRLHLRVEELAYLMEDELINALNGKKVKRSIIHNRMNGFMFYIEDGKSYCLVDDVEKIAKEKFGFELLDKEVNELKGISASTGVVKGKVRIIEGVSDISKVQEGDVMIAVTTHPDFVSAMHRTVAIVTEEGGMTCHAAIVSREMGKPCVVGTQIATKVFKDGDLVEVNADKGVVRKV